MIAFFRQLRSSNPALVTISTFPKNHYDKPSVISNAHWFTAALSPIATCHVLIVNTCFHRVNQNMISIDQKLKFYSVPHTTPLHICREGCECIALSFWLLVVLLFDILAISNKICLLHFSLFMVRFRGRCGMRLTQN